MRILHWRKFLAVNKRTSEVNRRSTTEKTPRYMRAICRIGSMRTSNVTSAAEYVGLMHRDALPIKTDDNTFQLHDLASALSFDFFG